MRPSAKLPSSETDAAPQEATGGGGGGEVGGGRWEVGGCKWATENPQKWQKLQEEEQEPERHWKCQQVYLFSHR